MSVLAQRHDVACVNTQTKRCSRVTGRFDLNHERRRHAAGRSDHQVPMRADRGHLLVDGIGKFVNAANSCIGFKGLAELRGVMRALDYAERRYS
jgi:D-mannonate dehydratase